MLALGCLALAGTILVGLAGGYLIYRRSAAALPAPATTLGPGERLPLRITGVLRTPTGREHVREVPGELVRFVLGRPVAPPADGHAPDEGVAPVDDPTPDDEAAPEDVAPPARLAPVDVTPAEPGPDSPIATTLHVERDGRPQGVAVGRGEVSRLSIGQAMAFRGPRPALRILAGTGLLVLSFDSPGERDRAAAELLAETGLGPQGTDPTPDTREEPDGRLGIH